MANVESSRSGAFAGIAEGDFAARVDLPLAADELFDRLASPSVTEWWVRPGVFDTRQWAGDVRPGGRWEASGIGRGQPYSLEGEFLTVERPRRLVHTWHPAASPAPPTTVSYDLEQIDGGTRLTLRHSGNPTPEATEANGSGWETSLARLAELLEER
jgi:uncharacterized protein YndB with AHSA1/START domain